MTNLQSPHAGGQNRISTKQPKKTAAELEAIHQTASERRSAKSEMAFDIYKQCWAILSAQLVS